MLGDETDALIFLLASITVGFSIPVLVMIRILVGREMPAGSLSGILLEQLLALKVLIVTLAFYRYSSAIEGDRGRLPLELVELAYIFLVLQGIVTIYRVGEWWLAVRSD